jgi:hypothetical protein
MEVMAVLCTGPLRANANPGGWLMRSCGLPAYVESYNSLTDTSMRAPSSIGCKERAFELRAEF